ncbi:MAG TPA: hypothetical protein VFC65_11565 [Prolixibacteraceae bacterium]|nr:hypothetical protein [Prolixibacteraceae bacterium]
MTEKVEIKRINKNEFHINDMVVMILEDNIIEFSAIGSPSEEFANACYQLDAEMLKEIEGKAYRIINLNKAGKPSKKAREIFQKLLKEHPVEKTAFIAANPVAKIIASFIISFLNNDDIKVFSSQKNAIEWFKSK